MAQDFLAADTPNGCLVQPGMIPVMRPSTVHGREILANLVPELANSAILGSALI